MYSKSRVYLLRDHEPAGLSASRSVGFPKWTFLIGRTGFDTIPSIPDPTLSLTRGYPPNSTPAQPKSHRLLNTHTRDPSAAIYMEPHAACEDAHASPTLRPTQVDFGIRATFWVDSPRGRVGSASRSKSNEQTTPDMNPTFNSKRNLRTDRVVGAK